MSHYNQLFPTCVHISKECIPVKKVLWLLSFEVSSILTSMPYNAVDSESILHSSLMLFLAAARVNLTEISPKNQLIALNEAESQQYADASSVLVHDALCFCQGTVIPAIIIILPRQLQPKEARPSKESKEEDCGQHLQQPQQLQ